MPWTGAHRAFVVENFITNGESVTATLRNFRTHYYLRRHDPFLIENLYYSWSKILEIQVQRSSVNLLEDQEVSELQRTSKLLESLFCSLQGTLLISILLH